MSVYSLNTLNTTNKVRLNTDGTGNKTDSTASNYLRDTSIFTIAANRSGSNSLTDPSNSDKALLSDGKNAKSKASGATTGATGWINKCKSLTANMMKANTNVVKTEATMQQQGQKALQMLTKSGVQAAKLADENKSIDSELAGLMSEKESMMKGNETGVGDKSAFSLSFDTGEEQPKKTQGLLTNHKGRQKDSGDNSNISSIDSKIATLAGRSSSNAALLESTIRSSSSTAKMFQSSLKNSHHVFGAQQKEAEKSASDAQSANTVGTITTVIGTATSAVGLAMAAGIITAPAAPPVTGAGVAGSTAGAGATAAATATSAATTTTVSTLTKVMTALPKIEKAIGIAQSALGLYTSIKSQIKS